MSKLMNVFKATLLVLALTLTGLGMFPNDSEAQVLEITCSDPIDNCTITNDSGSITLRLVDIRVIE